MSTFADRLITAIRAKGNPCVVGLDPRIEMMPRFVTSAVEAGGGDAFGDAITRFHDHVLDAAADLVPAVKLQSAFYEQYGLPGMRAFAGTIERARAAGLVVIVDAKRNDIGSTAEAYANAFLARISVLGRPVPTWDVDCITVSPFLGRDSLEPFADACREHGKGIFVLVKTSNPGSRDLQDQLVETGEPLSVGLAAMVDELGAETIGDSGYSSIGAVVGATFPEEAELLRRLMPRAIILVPGYGAQGGTADGAAVNFNADGLGAVVNASRSITYEYGDVSVTPAEFTVRVRENVAHMVADIKRALAHQASPQP